MVKLLSLLSAALAGVAAVQAAQLPVHPASHIVDHENFPAPESSLSALGAEEWTHFSHPAFPGYGARVKRAKDFCDPDVKAFTGYIDVGPKHLFFYFFESRNDPAKDDLLMWINGGPGGSSAIGLFMELGPCRVNMDGNSTTPNPYSWNDHANIFFLDQPTGVGFSYADYGETTETSEDAAKVVTAFMYMFTETFPEFKGRKFHMSGESYAGRYIPVFASEIVDQNKKAEEKGLTPINLSSVMIGNGYTDVKEMVLSYYDMTCTNASVLPVLSIEQCVRMRRSVPRCRDMVETSCRKDFSDLGCTAATLFCNNELVFPLYESGINPYDLSMDCGGTFPGTLCYEIIPKIADYLNRKDVRAIMGVESGFGKYNPMHQEIGLMFKSHLDEWHANQYYISSLLERGIDVLIYVGTYDWICNWVGNSRWVEAMEWWGQKEYNSKEFEEWTVDGHAAGFTKKSRGLTFATVYAAGHMVPYDKPAESLALINRWMESRDIFE